MKQLWMFSLILFSLLGCTERNHNNQQAFRRPANSKAEPELDSEKITNFMRLILKLHKEHKNTKFYIVNLPPLSGSDLRPAGADSIFDKVAEDNPELKHPHNLFSSLDNKQQKSWLEFMDEKEKLRNILTTNLNRKERDELLTFCFSYGVAIGDELFVVPTATQYTFCAYSGLLHTELEVQNTLKQFPAQPKGVKYDGQRGYHVYTNPLLQQQVQILTAAINTHLHRFYELFMSQSEVVKEKFRANTDGTNEKDKTEPFDLLSTYTTFLIMGKNRGIELVTNTPLNKIQVSKISQKALARVLHMKNTQQWNSLPNMIISRSQNTMSVMCAEGLPTSEYTKKGTSHNWIRSSTGTELLEVWMPDYNLDEILQKGITTSHLSCNNVDYQFQFKPIEAEPIPEPNPIIFSTEQPIHALMTVSLVNEIDRSAVDQARQLVNLFTGWEVVGDILSVKTKDFLEKELVKADAYFPVMHSMDINYFNIGTETSFAIRLKKSILLASGIRREIYLSILLPDKNSNLHSVIMKPADLAKIMHQRLKNKPTSLFLMNNSCSSEKTLLAWTLIFREALELRKKSSDFKGMSSVKDFPHVIGSKRQFGTSSILEIFSHSQYPLRSLEMLGEGKSVREIVEFLKKPQESAFIQSLTKFFKTDKKLEDPKGFEPVYILDHPEILSLGGIRITVTSPAIQGRDQY